jgi:DNA processing protein
MDGACGSVQQEDQLYWLALLRAPGLGPIAFRQILTHFSSPREFFHCTPAERREQVRLPSSAEAYLAKPDWPAIEEDLAWAEADNTHHIITLQDAAYPERLHHIPDPPPVLFVRGQCAALHHPQLAMVGSRNPSAGGRRLAEDFACRLAQAGLVITSGLALGIDAHSHRGALDGQGWTVAVAGTGSDRIYPARHRDLALEIVDNGAIVTEFPPGTPPLAGNFPRRNRIISGLSLGTLVVEAAPRSGSLITARLAAEQGREVFAIPGSIHNPLARGCHHLLRQGAKLVETLDDILEELIPLVSLSNLQQATIRVDEPATTEMPANNGSESLLENMGFEPISIDEMIERSGLTAEAVSSMLLTLELQGCVTSTGGLYSRTDRK